MNSLQEVFKHLLNNKRIIFPIFVLLFLPQLVYAMPREEEIDRVLAEIECLRGESARLTRISQPAVYQPDTTPVPQPVRERISPPKKEPAREKKNPQVPGENIFWYKDGIYFGAGARIGYLKGLTSYDFNHHTSELEFPMSNFMGGVNFNLGYKDLSLSAEVWLPLESYAGYRMEDKDWFEGYLWSFTKSKANMDAIIWDAALRYDFYKKIMDPRLNDLQAGGSNYDRIKIGALLGYKFERFDYDIYDVWDQIWGDTSYEGQRVLTYNAKYYLPYLGLVIDGTKKNFGGGFNIKYSFYPIARDVDNHLLRYLTTYGDYDKNGQAWMVSAYIFYSFPRNWQFRAGADYTGVRIDGVNWEVDHDPDWDLDKSIDTQQLLFWSGLEYRF